MFVLRLHKQGSSAAAGDLGGHQKGEGGQLQTHQSGEFSPLPLMVST